MSVDITHILKDWNYEPGKITARRIKGKDGLEKIQLRLDLGLLQMEVSGRPDGDRPNGHDSYLSFYEHELQKYSDNRKGNEVGFELDEQACELLRAEGMMYYHRYLAEFILEDFKAVERDTMRNLRLMDFCNRYAAEESDRYVLEQYRPYVVMMRARARGHQSLKDNRPKAAKEAIKNGIDEIKEFHDKFGQEKLLAGSSEIAILQAMLKDIERRIPVDPLEKLRRKLSKAIKEERYEDAALIRDKMDHFKSDGFEEK